MESNSSDSLSVLIKHFEKENPNSTIKVSDLLQVLTKLRTQEQNVQRSLRALARENNDIRNNHTLLCTQVNTALAQLSQHINPNSQQHITENIIESDYNSDTQKALEQEMDDVNMLSNNHGIQLAPFSGDGSVPFSDWLLKFNDFAEGHIPPWTRETKARKLPLYLTGLPRQQYKSLSEEEKRDFDRAIEKLRNIYESPAQRDIARQRLYQTFQRDSETVHEFAERLQQLVTAATSGLNTSTFNDTLRDHFLDRLHPRLRYHVKREHPLTFEKAFESALENECLLKDQELAEKNIAGQLNINNHPMQRYAQAHEQQQTEMLDLLREIRDKLSVSGNQANSANKGEVINEIRAGFRALRPAQQRTPNRNSRTQYPRQNRYSVTQRDRNIANSTRRYERNYDGRPYCTFCRRMGHLEYNCYDRQTPPRYSPDRRGEPYRPNRYSPPRDERESHRRWREESSRDHQRSPSRDQVPRRRSGSRDRYFRTVNAYEHLDSHAYISTIYRNDKKSLGSNQIQHLLHDSVENASVNAITSSAPNQQLPNQHAANHDAPPTAIVSYCNLRGNNEPAPQVNIMRDRSARIRSTQAENSQGNLTGTAIFITFLLWLLFSSAMAALPNVLPSTPLLCQGSLNPAFWRLPDSPNCPILNSTVGTRIQKLNLTVFRPNTIRYETKAYACRIIHTKIFYYTNFINDEFSRTETDELEVTQDQCDDMVRFKRCKHGDLALKGELYRTENSLDFKFPWPIIGSFHERMVQATNCYLFETLVTSLHDSKELASPAGKMNACKYEDGSCLLRDRTRLVWIPEETERCQYIRFQSWDGQLLNNVWLTNSREFALSFPRNAKHVNDCKSELVITDQGYAVLASELSRIQNIRRPRKFRKFRKESQKLTQRSRRETSRSFGYNVSADMLDKVEFAQHPGAITTNQLAAQLQALYSGLAQSLTLTFQHTLSSICEAIKLLSNQLQISFTENPTLTARSLLNNTNLQARLVSDVLEVWPCVPVSKTGYGFIGTNDTDVCYEYPPVRISFADEHFYGFLDPRTLIVSEVSRRMSCHFVRYTPIALDGQLFVLDQVMGTLELIIEDRISTIQPALISQIKIPSIPATIFHNLLITNLTETFPSLHLASLTQLSAIEKEIHQHNRRNKQSSGSTAFSTGSTFSLFTVFRTPWYFWVTIICAIVTFKLLLRPLLLLLCPQLYAIFRILDGFRQRQLLSTTSHSKNVQDDTSAIPLKELSNWPPQVHVPSLATLELSSLNARAFSAQVLGYVNSIQLKLLIDTGAGISLAPSRLLPALGVELRKIKSSAVGVSGHPLNIIGTGKVKVNIAGIEIECDLHFSDNEHINTGAVYDVIIGCDILELFPPFTVDIPRQKFTVGGNSIQIGRTNRTASNKPGIRISSSITIPPASEAFVACILSDAFRIDAKAFMIDQPDPRISQLQLYLTPGIICPVDGTIHLLLSNPTNEYIYLRQHMHIADAIPLQEREGMLTALKDDPANLVLSTYTPPLKSIPYVDVDPTYCIDFALCDIEPHQTDALKRLTRKYEDIFSKHKYDLGSCTAVLHDIQTTTELPVSCKPTRIPFKYREELQNHINSLLRSGALKESKTNWVANLVLVQKKDGSLRPCVDYRKLNAVTVTETFPLPRLETILEQIGNCYYYTSLDLSQGFLQIKVSDEMSNKLGLILEDKCYQFTHLPFGLKNATSIFCRTMAKVFAGMQDGVCFYVDDLLVYTKSPHFRDHLATLERVFQRLRDFNLKLSPRKCQFARRSIEFLGHTIQKDGYRPSPANLDAIAEFPVPRSVQQVRRFCGLAGFYRKFIPQFALIASPLTELTRKNCQFSWGPRQQQAFVSLKEHLMREPILSYPNYDKPFHIFTDCSSVAQAGALLQLVDGTKSQFYSISYCSRSLSESERKWPIIQAELATIVYALRTFKPYIFMSECIVHTDHKPLTHVLKKPSAHPNLARWVIELQSYNIKLEYIKGERNKVADALSRVDDDKEPAKRAEMHDIIEFPHCLTNVPLITVDNPGTETIFQNIAGRNHLIDLKTEQSKDKQLKPIITFLKTGNLPAFRESQQAAIFISKAERYILDDNGYLRFRMPPSEKRKRFELEHPLVIPVTLRPLIFDHFHLSSLAGGHLNFKKVFHKTAKYYWDTKYSDLYRWTKACAVCQMRNNPCPYPRQPLHPVTSTAPMNHLGLDLCGPFPATQRGNKFIFNVICLFTKYVISVPVEDSRATTLARALLNHCILVHGTPNILTTDNATTFTSDFFQEFCRLLYISKRYATPYHSAGNGAVERTFRTFQNMLSKYITDQNPDFDEFLPAITFCYNTSIHEMTGETPFFLMFGRDPRFPIENIIRTENTTSYSEEDIDIYKQQLIQAIRTAWTHAHEYNLQAQERMKRQYDRLAQQSSIKEGDHVLLQRLTVKPGQVRKYHLPWTGIFRVIEITPPNALIISCGTPTAKPFRVHINQLKPYFFIDGPALTLPAIPEEDLHNLHESGAQQVDNLPGYNYESEPVSDDQPVPDTPNTPQQTHRYNLRPRN